MRPGEDGKERMKQEINCPEATTIRERISALRQLMKTAGVHYYFVTTGDPHGSEYINDHYKVREYLSGFTGSNGDLLVGEEEALLWTDGRYFVQAERELSGTGIQLMKSQQAGVPTLLEYLKAQLEQPKQGRILAFEGVCIPAVTGNQLEKLFRDYGGEVVSVTKFLDSLWSDRPKDSEMPIRQLPIRITGEEMDEKIRKVRDKMETEGASHLLISKLEDQMWLFNLRGNDICYNPVAYSYTLISKHKILLGLKPASVDEGLRQEFQNKGICIADYRDMQEEVKQELLDYSADAKKKPVIMLDLKSTNYSFCELVKKHGEIREQTNPTELLKAMKNETEIENLKDVYLKDSVVLTRFIKQIKTMAKENHLPTESEAAQMLNQARLKMPECFDLAFDTISAYGANAAMMHYEAVEGKDAQLKPEGIYLVDSGGQYDGGTTDVTRSIVLGPITKEMKKHYTLALMGMLRLQNAVFLHGCTGKNLDILARGPLWKNRIDYKCGTGHGVGYMLSVHEGPQNISWRVRNYPEAIIEEGMLLSDEPGVYIADSHGIRIENVILCKKMECTEDGQFMGFEPLTFVPVDPAGIDITLMEREDIEYLNSYNKMVYEKLSPHFKEEEQEWLRMETIPIGL